jgi:hypothetical protein
MSSHLSMPILVMRDTEPHYRQWASVVVVMSLYSQSRTASLTRLALQVPTRQSPGYRIVRPPLYFI